MKIKIVILLALSLNFALATSKTELIQSYSKTIELDKKMDNRVTNEQLSQWELNELAQQNYELWDKQLNKIWAYLKKNLPKNKLEKLTLEQKKWIKEKESQAEQEANNNAGEGATRGSMWNMIYYGRLSSLTEQRVKELMDLVKAEKASSAKPQKAATKTKGDIFKAYGILINEDEKIRNSFRKEDLEGVIRLTKKQYNLWDKQLNLIWKYLKVNLAEQEMQDLTIKQREWVKYKEDLAKQRANGAHYPDLAYYSVLVDETQKKVEELIKLVK